MLIFPSCLAVVLAAVCASRYFARVLSQTKEAAILVKLDEQSRTFGEREKVTQ